MGKKVLVVSTSIRNGSNSEILAHEVERGALDAGNEVEFVSLAGREIGFCRGCLACQKTGNCVIRDEMDALIGKVREADVIVFATPIYYYEMSGQMKVFLDRCNPLYISDYKFRSVYLATASAEEGDDVAERAARGLQGWIECFPKASFGGMLQSGGVTGPNEAAGREELLAAAREFGRRV
ncbi:flavodoxin family protein [uncultured Senegalimassilia sp.]|uniref:flavodoxin family protein n=1 Tax=uncultured Senegalimassilia sp. TaxID=1714350 RepID=UPI0027DC3B81|nr:flavodoxin family protein [uncultured Senegalimassilia sp.]